MNKYTRKDFLEALFSDYFGEREGFLMVKIFRRTDKKQSTRYFPNMEILAKETFSEDQNVFLGTCPHENMKPDRGHIRYMTALWAGLDLNPEGYSGKRVYFFGQPQAAKAIRSFPLPPSIIVESGTGVHLYWLMKELVTVTDPDAMESLLGRINAYFKCNTHIPLNSIMRLPFTLNSKLSSHIPTCSIKYINTDFRYSLEEFQDLEILSQMDSRESETWTGILKDSNVKPENGNSNVNEIPTVSAAAREIPAKMVLEKARHAQAVPKKSRTGSDRMDFEPVPYEDAFSEESPALAPNVNEISALLTDEIVDKIAERVSALVLEKLSDEIVAKLSKRLGIL